MDDRVAITLLRHGLTEENERKAYIGWTDSPLSEKGAEAIRLLEHSFNPEILFSSPMRRTMETAESLFPGQMIHRLPEMKEMNFGLFERKTYLQLKDDTSYTNWLASPFTDGPPGGESFQTFADRIENGWEKIVNKIFEVNASHAVIVTHGGVMRYLLTTYTSVSKSFFDWKVPHGGGYQLLWSKDHLRRQETCMSLQEVPITVKQIGLEKPMN